LFVSPLLVKLGPRVARFFLLQYTKTVENIPKQGKYTKTGKIYQNRENIPKQGKYTKTGKIYQNRENIPKQGKYTKVS
jgi:hypothetical protein